MLGNDLSTETFTPTTKPRQLSICRIREGLLRSTFIALLGISTIVNIACIVLAQDSQTAGAGEEPLPQMPAFWQAVQANLMRQYEETDILKGYTYRRDFNVEQLDKDGAVKQREHAQYEVYYFETGPFNKLISKNDVPLSQRELDRQNVEMQKLKTKKRKGGVPWKGRRTQRSPKEQKEILDDIYKAFDFRVLRREMLDGRSTVVVDFSPRPNVKLHTIVARAFLPKLAGSAWIDEQDHVLAKVVARTTQDIKFGMGLLAGISRNSEYEREWTKVNGEVWLPRHYEMRFKARAFLAKGYNLRLIDDFSEYKKFSVETIIKPSDDSTDRERSLPRNLRRFPEHE